MAATAQRVRSWRLAVWLAACLVFAPTTALAGGGPENALLVVNARSWASLTIANHYAQLRKIPDSNILYVDWPGSIDAVDVQTFREALLRPIQAAIQERNLGSRIDYIVYSSDFPWSVDAHGDCSGLKLPPVSTPVGALSAATYLAPLVAASQTRYVALDVNRYARLSAEAQSPPTRAFRSWYGWGPDGNRLEAGGESYFISAMLGYTGGRGNSVAEVVSYLTRAAGSDGSLPKGTIYFMRNDDVRSKTRLRHFDAAVSELERLGVKAEVLEGTIPQQKDDVQGCMIGSAAFSWGSSGSTIRPGAFCDHLTSLGGILRENGGQTPLTQLLRYGAAGASGTVVEPYALPQKFPLPFMHVHYARGCSLGEAFYQSVSAPFQLLLVGDPLCQPWARPPTVTISGVAVGEVVKGPLEMTAAGASALENATVDRFEWHLDGAHVARTNPTEKVTLNTAGLADGTHEIRVVAADTTAIEPQGRAVVSFVTDNYGKAVAIEVKQPGTIRYGDSVTVSLSAPGSLAIAVFCRGRVMGRVAGDQGTLVIDSRLLGMGPVRLHAAAIGSGGVPSNAVSAPVDFTIEAPQPLEPQGPIMVRSVKPGFEVLPQGAPEPTIVSQTTSGNWLEQAGVGKDQAYQIDGLLQIHEPGLHQFALSHAGQMKLTIGDEVVFESSPESTGRHYVPVSLSRGSYRLKIEAVAAGAPRLDWSFGMTGTRRVDGDILMHRTAGNN